MGEEIGVVCCEPTSMAKVIGEGLTTPAESVLDGGWLGSCFMQSDTSSNANGMGCPTSKIVGVGNTVCNFGGLLEPGTDVSVGEQV